MALALISLLTGLQGLGPVPQAHGATQITIDGNLADWNGNIPTFLDPSTDAGGGSGDIVSVRLTDRIDCPPDNPLKNDFFRMLLEKGVLDRVMIESIHEEARAEAEAALEEATQEPKPRPEDVEKFTYADSPVDAVYPGDYTGLP